MLVIKNSEFPFFHHAHRTSYIIHLTRRVLDAANRKKATIKKPQPLLIDRSVYTEIVSRLSVDGSLLHDNRKYFAIWKMTQFAGVVVEK